MKIFFVAAFAPQSDPTWFSLGRMRKVGQVAQLLKDINHEVHYLNIAPFDVRAFGQSGSPVAVTTLCSTSFLPVRFLQLFFKSAYFFWAIRPWCSLSVLWLYNTRSAESTVALAALILRPQLRLVLQLEDLASAREAHQGLRGAMDRFTSSCLSRRANRVFAVSDAVANSFSIQTQFPYEEIKILPPVLDPLFSQLASERLEPFSSSHYTILYAGSFDRDKGVYDLIEAFLSLGKINTQLILAGSAPGKVKETYSAATQIIFTGVIPEAELFSLYTTSDVVVNPHRKIVNPSHIFPFKLIETISSGALPLTTPVPGSENFGLPADCFFVDTKDLREKLSNAPQLWHRNRASVHAASSLCRQRYSSDVIKAKIASSLSSL